MNPPDEELGRETAARSDGAPLREVLPDDNLPDEALSPESTSSESTPPESTPRNGPNGEDQLRALRALLIGPEVERIERVESELHDKERLARTVSEVLPQAVAERAQSDSRLKRALTPTIEEAIQESVRKNPKGLADAIFPILGPAIRKAIAHTFASLAESINQTIEHTFSVQSLKWRMQAKRTGRPFSEIVIANSLVYRVEHVLLFHRETGIRLQDVVAPGLEGKDPDLVSAMLMGIQDFVRDSFSADRTDELDQARVGKYVLVVEQGPLALVCAAVLGTPPGSLRTKLQEALETIHSDKASALREFDGDTTPFETARMELEDCLAEQQREKPKRGRAMPIALITTALAAVILCVVWWVVSWRRSEHWNDYLARLASEPGIVVADSGERDGAQYVTGLRDPYAADPELILGDMGISSERVISRWEPYQAAHPPFVLRRVERLLAPPPGVSLTLRKSTLVIAGSASMAWLDQVRRWTELLPWIEAIDTNELAVVDPASQDGSAEPEENGR